MKIYDKIKAADRKELHALARDYCLSKGTFAEMIREAINDRLADLDYYDDLDETERSLRGTI